MEPVEEDGKVGDKYLRILASIGLAVGGLLGLAGTFAPSASLRGLAWGIDGLGLVVASALLVLGYCRKGQDLVASGSSVNYRCIARYHTALEQEITIP